MKILNETVSSITPRDASWVKRSRQRLDELVMPHWALGRLMDLAVDLAGMTRSLKPVVRRKVIVIMAADHGVVDEGVSKYPQDVTWQMVENFVRRGAGINALAAQAGADVCVVDMGVAKGMGELAGSGSIISMPVAKATANIARGPAMTRQQAVTSLENGIRVARRMVEDEGYDLIGVGEMGIGNTTPSSAIITVFSGASVSEATGPGTGIDDGQMRHKITVIERAIELNRPDPEDGLDVLSKIGGFEIGGIAGLILGTAAQKRPVVIDGLISTAGALIARSLAPASVDYMVAAHRSAEKGHILALRGLGKEPLLDLGLRLGEGTGAVLAMNLVEAAVRIMTDVSTFSEAGVSGAVE